jgi:epoxide hydrolase
MPPRSFSVHVPEAVLDDLQKRLAATRWPEPIPGSGWEYGANTDFIRDLCAYWRDGYDWREHERQLNRFPGFLAEVDGVEIHFWHVKGKGPSPFPLLLIHGWPGSIFEFHSILDRLTDPASHGGSADDAFDVVVPALPGFGWSGKPRERGWGITRIARAFDTLMATELGYRRYGVQGGDWGGIIAAKMGSAHATNLAGIHLNFVTARIPAPESTSDPAERAAIEARTAFQARETGYSNVQGTKPDSLTLAQADSPAGLAAWVVEKFRIWSDCGGDVLSAFSKDDLLTNLMFYWAPPSIASAARIYYEATRDPGAFAYPRVEVPTGVAVFPAEPWRVPRSWAEPRFNITRWTELEKGGHFAALEQPALLYEDIRAFFATVRYALTSDNGS